MFYQFHVGSIVGYPEQHTYRSQLTHREQLLKTDESLRFIDSGYNGANRPIKAASPRSHELHCWHAFSDRIASRAVVLTTKAGLLRAAEHWRMKCFSFPYTTESVIPA